LRVFFISIITLNLGNDMMSRIYSYLCVIVKLAGFARLY